MNDIIKFITSDCIKIDKQDIERYGIKASYIKALFEQRKITTISELILETGFSKKTVEKHLKMLLDKNVLNKEKLTQEQIKNLLLTSEGKLQCEWCKAKVHLIHKHHYPIPERLGGVETVNICPNCHTSFHKIEIDNDGFKSV